MRSAKELQQEILQAEKPMVHVRSAARFGDGIVIRLQLGRQSSVIKSLSLTSAPPDLPLAST